MKPAGRFLGLLAAAVLAGGCAREVNCADARNRNEKACAEKLAPGSGAKAGFTPAPNPTNWLEVYGTKPESAPEKK